MSDAPLTPDAENIAENTAAEASAAQSEETPKGKKRKRPKEKFSVRLRRNRKNGRKA